MRKHEADDHITRAFREGTLIDLALARGALDALQRHKRAGIPVVEWRDGRAVLVPPEEIDTRSLQRTIEALARKSNGSKKSGRGTSRRRRSRK